MIDRWDNEGGALPKKTPEPEAMVTIRLPRSHWRQIVSDLENMCGTGEEDIEILQSVEILNAEQ